MSQRKKKPEYIGLGVIGWLMTIFGWLYVVIMAAISIFGGVVAINENSGSIEKALESSGGIAIAFLTVLLPGVAVAAAGNALLALRDIARNSWGE